MGEAILLMLWFGFTLFLIIKEKHDRDTREGREWWISEVRECIHSIELEYQSKCEKITEKYFEKYIDVIGLNGYRLISEERLNLILSEYRSRINELKDDYLQSVIERIVERKGKYFITSMPAYLEKEYETDISRIADTFYEFHNCMERYVWDIKLARIDGTDPRTARKAAEEKAKKEMEEFILKYR